MEWSYKKIEHRNNDERPMKVSRKDIPISSIPLKEQMLENLIKYPKKIENKLSRKLLRDLKWRRHRKGSGRAFRYETLARIHGTTAYLHGTFDFEERYFQIMCAIFFEERLLSPLDLNQMVVNVKDYYESLFKCFETIGGFDDIIFIKEEEPLPSLLVIADSMDVSLDRNKYAHSERFKEWLHEKYGSRDTAQRNGMGS